MNDLPSTIAMQQSYSRPMTGEELEVLGKTASSKFVTGKYQTLNEAVTETIKKAGLSPEQVRRVVEFANTDAFLQEFHKEGRDHRVVEFNGGPASYSDILKDLNDGGGGTVFDQGGFDYSSPPPDISKTASANLDLFTNVECKELVQAFKCKEASIPYADPLRDAIEAKEKLSTIYEQLGSEINHLEVQFMDDADRLYDNVKQAALQGATLGEMISVWRDMTDSPEFVKAAFQYMTPRLLEDGVFASKNVIGESLMKTASGVANYKHPVATCFTDFCGTIYKLAEARSAQVETENGLNQITNFLKLAAGAETAGKAIGGGLKSIAGHWKNLTGATAGIGETVAKHVGEAGFKGTGNVIGGAIKYSPHAAALIGGHELLTRAQHNPAVAGTTNIIMRNVPYTKANLQHQYELAQG